MRFIVDGDMIAVVEDGFTNLQEQEPIAWYPFTGIEGLPELIEAHTVINLLLDSADYEDGACKINEPVGGVIPRSILRRARKAVCREVRNG